MSVESQLDVSSAYPTDSLYKQDEILAKMLQQEENDIAAYETNMLRSHAELAASLNPKYWGVDSTVLRLSPECDVPRLQKRTH